MKFLCHFKKIRQRLGDENCSSSHGVILSNVTSFNIFLLDVNFENLTIKFGSPIYTCRGIELRSSLSMYIVGLRPKPRVRIKHQTCIKGGVKHQQSGLYVEGKDEKGRKYKRRRSQWEIGIEKSIEKHYSNQEPNL